MERGVRRAVRGWREGADVGAGTEEKGRLRGWDRSGTVRGPLDSTVKKYKIRYWGRSGRLLYWKNTDTAPSMMPKPERTPHHRGLSFVIILRERDHRFYPVDEFHFF